MYDSERVSFYCDTTDQCPRLNKNNSDIIACPRRLFWIPGTGFQSLIPLISGIRDSLSCISDSKPQDSGFHQHVFPGFRIPEAIFPVFRYLDSLMWGEPFNCRLPCSVFGLYRSRLQQINSFTGKSWLILHNLSSAISDLSSFREKGRKGEGRRKRLSWVLKSPAGARESQLSYNT